MFFFNHNLALLWSFENWYVFLVQFFTVPSSLARRRSRAGIPGILPLEMRDIFSNVKKVGFWLLDYNEEAVFLCFVFWHTNMRQHWCWHKYRGSLGSVELNATSADANLEIELEKEHFFALTVLNELLNVLLSLEMEHKLSRLKILFLQLSDAVPMAWTKVFSKVWIGGSRRSEFKATFI